MLKQISDDIYRDTAVIKVFQMLLKLVKQSQGMNLLFQYQKLYLLDRYLTVKMALNTDRALWGREKADWDKKAEAKREQRAEELQLETIVELKRQGMTQKQIGELANRQLERD